MPYEIDILGEIGSWGYPANYLRYQLADAAGEPVQINISSPGGEVTEGLAMFDMLTAYTGEVETVGFGLVASIASVVLLAGKRVKMTPNSFLMIHNPWAMAVGTSTEMSQTAELLDKMGEQLTNIYVSRLESSGKASGNTRLRVQRMMDAETWLTAQEAFDMGFIDEIQEASKQANIIQMQPALARYVNTPAALLPPQNSDDMTAKQLLDKVKAMLGTEQETVEAEATVEATTKTDETVTITADQAKEVLAAAGYAVMTAEELAALTAKVDEESQTNTQLAETMQTLAAEVVALRNQVKAQVGMPSGGTTSDVKADNKPKASAFDGLAAIFKQKTNI